MFFMISLKYFYNNLLELEVNGLLYLLIKLTNFTLENNNYFIEYLFEILFSKLILI